MGSLKQTSGMNVWEATKKLWAEGSLLDEDYVDLINEGEKRDQVRDKVVTSIGVL